MCKQSKKGQYYVTETKSCLETKYVPVCFFPVCCAFANWCVCNCVSTFLVV